MSSCPLLVLFLMVCKSEGHWHPEWSLPAALPVGTPRLCDGAGQQCFSYDRDSIIGPPHWDNVCQTKFCFNGMNQSPVYIDPDNVQWTCGPRIQYRGDPSVDLKVTNEGIYPSGAAEGRDQAMLSGVPGDNNGYVFTNVHVHFRGGEDNIGQEHQFGNSDFDGEMHIIHRNVSVSAENQNLVVGGRAVIGVFLSTQYGERSAELDRFLDLVTELQEYKLKLCRKFFDKCYRPMYGPDYFEDDRSNRREDRRRDEDTGIKKSCAKFFSRPLRCRVNDDICENDENGRNGENGEQKENGKTGENGEGEENGKNGDNGEKGGGRWRRKGGVDPRPDKCPDAVEGCVDDHEEECEITLSDFHPDRLLPRRRDFVYYYGGLTSPPVSEAIRWQVMVQPIRITQRQLRNLQNMESREQGVPIVENGNVRPLQPLNGRQILGNYCR